MSGSSPGRQEHEHNSGNEVPAPLTWNACLKKKVPTPRAAGVGA